MITDLEKKIKIFLDELKNFDIQYINIELYNDIRFNINNIHKIDSIHTYIEDDHKLSIIFNYQDIPLTVSIYKNHPKNTDDKLIIEYYIT